VGTLVARLQLHSPLGTKRPSGIVRVAKRGGTFGVTIVGTGLPANSKHNAYAVWLTNRRHQSELLGFVSPPVKTNGRIQTAGILPRHAFRYDTLLISVETRPKPTAPGAVILKASFHR
jgi:hypothetical protein